MHNFPKKLQRHRKFGFGDFPLNTQKDAIFIHYLKSLKIDIKERIKFKFDQTPTYVFNIFYVHFSFVFKHQHDSEN